MTKLELIRGNVTLDISDEISFQHEENSGFGMPPLHRINERGPLQHGVTDLGYRLDPRTIQLVIPMLTTGWSDHFDRRATLLDVINPVYNQVINLRFTLPDGSMRQLDCYAIGGPLFTTRDQIAGGSNMRAGFSLYAPDPAWYDPTAQTITLGQTGGGAAWLIPWAIPWTIGGSTLDDTYSLDYPGTWLAYPQIIITGPITDPVVTNLQTGAKLDFTGITIASGHYYNIDTRYGYKTVLLDGVTNKLADLTTDSDLVDWAILPGPNPINATGTAIDGNTRININYKNQFLGV